MLTSDYNQFQVISQSKFSTVYKAYQRSLQRWVVVKKLAVSSEFSLDTAKQEATLISALQHPNIITIYDLVEKDNQIFIVMEYLDGKTLGEYLAQPSLIQPELGLVILRLVLEALSAIHSRGIIHCDVKPNNIFITTSGIVKLTDFGLSQVIGSHPRLISGTPLYLSPEQIKKEPLSPKTDIFSLGVIIYQVFQNSYPFRGETTSEILNSIVQDEFKPLPPSIHSEIKALISSCLKKDPLERLTAEELQKPIDKYLAQCGIFNYFKEIEAWQKQPQEYLSKLKERKIKNLTEIAKGYLQEGQVHQAIATLENVLQIDKSDPEALRLLEEISPPASRRRFLTRRGIFYLGSVLIVSGLLLLNYWEKIFNSSLPIPGNARVEPLKRVSEAKEKILPSHRAPSVEKKGVKEKTKTVSLPSRPESKSEKPVEKVAFGSITIFSSPWSQVYINGKYYRDAPFSQPLILKAGRYRLKLVNQSCEVWEKEIEVKPSENVHFKVFLKLKRYQKTK